jgi:hypothetical protein
VRNPATPLARTRRAHPGLPLTKRSRFSDSVGFGTDLPRSVLLAHYFKKNVNIRACPTAGGGHGLKRCKDIAQSALTWAVSIGPINDIASIHSHMRPGVNGTYRAFSPVSFAAYMDMRWWMPVFCTSHC